MKLKRIPISQNVLNLAVWRSSLTIVVELYRTRHYVAIMYRRIVSQTWVTKL